MKEYHFIQEVREQPTVVRKTLEHLKPQLQELAQFYANRIDRIILIGCGDPYMLGIAAAYAFERWVGIPAESIEAAEFTSYRSHLVNERTLVILITSSGKTVKVIEAAQQAAQRRAPLLALTNLVPSPITAEITAETDRVLQTQAGWSDSFPTKQTTTALGTLLALALYWSETVRYQPLELVNKLRNELFNQVPTSMTAVFQQEAQIESLALAYPDAAMYTFVGSGPNWITAMIGAAKIKETNQNRAIASNLEEYAHLHALPLKDGEPVFLITTPGPINQRNLLICRWIVENGGKPIVIGPPKERELWSSIDVQYVQVDDCNELFFPLIAVIPLQLFAYYVAIANNSNPDRPPERGGIGYMQKIIYTSMLEGWEKR